MNRRVYRRVRLEFKVEDMWVGVFWKRITPSHFDLWICLLPCLPVHYSSRKAHAVEHRDE